MDWFSLWFNGVNIAVQGLFRCFFRQDYREKTAGAPRCAVSPKWFPMQDKGLDPYIWMLLCPGYPFCCGALHIQQPLREYNGHAFSEGNREAVFPSGFADAWPGRPGMHPVRL